ncbi:hypothetical protein ACU3L3_07370 [Priestia endophytica]
MTEMAIHNELNQLREHSKQEGLPLEQLKMMNERQQELLKQLERLTFSPKVSDRIKELEARFDENEKRLDKISREFSKGNIRLFNEKFSRLQNERHNLLKQQKGIMEGIKALNNR